MCTRNELDMILRKIAEVYRSVYGDELVSIFLYGSYARGDYQSDSDIDVAAIVRGDRRSLQDKLKKVWDVSFDLELEYGTIVSPTVIPYEDLLQDGSYKDSIGGTRRKPCRGAHGGNS